MGARLCAVFSVGDPAFTSWSEWNDSDKSGQSRQVIPQGQDRKVVSRCSPFGLLLFRSGRLYSNCWGCLLLHQSILSLSILDSFIHPKAFLGRLGIELSRCLIAFPGMVNTAEKPQCTMLSGTSFISQQRLLSLWRVNAAWSPGHLVISKNDKVLVFWAFAYGWASPSKRNWLAGRFTVDETNTMMS